MEFVLGTFVYLTNKQKKGKKNPTIANIPARLLTPPSVLPNDPSDILSISRAISFAHPIANRLSTVITAVPTMYGLRFPYLDLQLSLNPPITGCINSPVYSFVFFLAPKTKQVWRPVAHFDRPYYLDPNTNYQ
ncbi:hypothetical protein AYI69_g686 [Smittium culicis]|uniref:Uncharacterized protein n=1 Tax=Smittium culicis TaxID=133412 RepID=A0A1R1YSA9_9FUNG|nr:hypothetical protein AYI69_g686 [Smittium culicis]